MQKLLAKVLLLFPALMVLVYITHLHKKKIKNIDPCVIPTRLSQVEESIPNSIDSEHKVLLVLHLNPQCQICYFLMDEISQWGLTSKILVFSYRGKRETKALLQNWEWCVTPDIIFTDELTVNRIFCSSRTPTILVYKSGFLLHHQTGIDHLGFVKRILDTS